jgi:hypothetical protein
LNHGYVNKTGGHVYRQLGQYQTYTLIKNPVSRPLVCDVCGQSLSAKVCDPLFLKQKTKKERKKKTEAKKETPIQESLPDASGYPTSKQWQALKRLTERRHTHER